MSSLALPLPYPLTVPECLKRDIIFYAPFLPDTGSRPHRLGGIASSSAEAVDAVGTYISARDRLVHPALANVLRIERKGALIEGARQNDVIWGKAFNLGNWIKQGTAFVTANTGQTTDPEGGNGAEIFNNLRNFTNGSIYDQLPNGSFGGSAVLRPSMWVKRKSTSGVIQFRSKGSGAGGRWQIDLAAIGPDWVHVQDPAQTGVTEVSPWRANTSGANGLQFDSAANDDLDYYAWGGQLEEAGFASSYIPTDGSAITRAADDLRYDNTNEVHCKAAQGMVVCVVTHGWGVGVDSDRYVYDFSDGTNGVGVFFDQSNAGKLTAEVLSGGAVVATLVALAAPVVATSYIVAVTWIANQFTLAINGVQQAQVTPGAAPTAMPVELNIGQNRSQALHLFGNLAHLMIFKRAPNPAEVKGVSDSIANWT
jgi:hypothetical protein